MYEIFEALQLNPTIFIQFVIILVFFFVIKAAFFNKLKFVLETRESKTTKLEEAANENFEKATKLAREYRVLIDETYDQAQEENTKKKEELLKEASLRVAKASKEADSFLKAKEVEIEQEIQTKRDEILKEAPALSNKLVEKIIQ